MRERESELLGELEQLQQQMSEVQASLDDQLALREKELQAAEAAKDQQAASFNEAS